MFSNTVTNVLPLSIVVAALAGLSGCGGDDDPPAAPPPTSPQPAPEPPSDPAPERQVTLAPTFTGLDAAATSAQPIWPAWTGTGTGEPVAGVGCARTEDYHIHAMLTIYRDGTRLAVPDALGRSGCTYELHTHDAASVIHIETDQPKVFTVGQLFALWGQPLTATDVAGLPGPYRYYVIENGTLTRYTGDPGAIELASHREIVILAGANPPAVLPKYQWPEGL